MMRKLSQTEYGYTAGSSLANGGLYVDDDGRVYFLTANKQAAPVPGPFSCHVKVVSEGSNTGGEGSTAVLQFEQGGGIDVRPGGPDTDYIMIQFTPDAEELVKRGAIIKFTLSAIEETP